MLGAALFASGARRAEAQDSQSVAASEALFQQGRQLMAAGKLNEACPKLLESLRLDPGIGTLLYLAECYEKNGQTASAWGRFREAADMAKAAGQPDRERKARERAQKLEAQLAHLTITVSPQAASTTGIDVQRDGVAVGSALWGAAIPIDPGTHRITATAPGKKAWSTTVEVAGHSNANASATVPPLEDAPPEVSGAAPAPSAPADTTVPAASPPPDSGSGMGTQRIAGLVLGAGGLVGIGVGVAFGLVAKSKNDEALQAQNCPDATHCYDTGIDLTQSARTAATVSTVAVIAGGVALAGGAVLFLTAPKRGPKASALSVRAGAAPAGGRVAISARF